MSARDAAANEPVKMTGATSDSAGAGIGSPADQSARLQHASERHGFAVLPCPKCDGRRGGCGFCDDADGLVFKLGDLKPCGPTCPLNDIRPT